MKSKFKLKAHVSWPYYGGRVRGAVEEIYFEPVVREIKGKFIKRNGSKEVPAYLVKSEAGNLALKLETELQEIPTLTKKRTKKWAL